MKTKHIILIVAVLAVIGAGIAYWQYNKPHRDAASEEVAFKMTASELYAAFDSDENAAMAKYGNQLIEVTGKAMESTTEFESNSMILLDSGNPLFGVKAMFQTPVINPPTTGEQVVIRGFCSGINGDVELTRCTIINNN